MNRQAVISVTALLALGAGIGVFWRQLEQEPAAEVAQLQDGAAAGMDGGTAAAPASTEQLAEKLRASFDGGDARPAVPQATESPEILQKRAAVRSKLEAEYAD